MKVEEIVAYGLHEPRKTGNGWWVAIDITPYTYDVISFVDLKTVHKRVKFYTRAEASKFAATWDGFTKPSRFAVWRAHREPHRLALLAPHGRENAMAALAASTQSLSGSQPRVSAR